MGDMDFNRYVDDLLSDDNSKQEDAAVVLKIWLQLTNRFPDSMNDAEKDQKLKEQDPSLSYRHLSLLEQSSICNKFTQLSHYRQRQCAPKLFWVLSGMRIHNVSNFYMTTLPSFARDVDLYTHRQIVFSLWALIGNSKAKNLDIPKSHLKAITEYLVLALELDIDPDQKSYARTMLCNLGSET